MKVLLLLTTTILHLSTIGLVLSDSISVYADVWCFSDKAESNALTTVQYSDVANFATGRMVAELKRQHLIPPNWKSEYAGKAKNEKRELIDCIKACVIYSKYFCVNILGCPGRRQRAMFEANHDVQDERSLMTMKEMLEIALPEAARKAMFDFPSMDATCDNNCSTAVSTVTCNATVDIV